MKGYFITLEGGEGSGKSTQLNLIEDYLKRLNYQVVTTYEPGDTKIGNKIRGILLDPSHNKLVPKAELLLYIADRVQHIAEVIKPALSEGKVVICDRYIDTTLVYQGIARKLSIDLINTLHTTIIDNLEPDLTFVFDIDPVYALKRAKQVTAHSSNNKKDRIESENILFHRQVRKGYLDLAQNNERMKVINANKSISEVFNQIKPLLKERLVE